MKIVLAPDSFKGSLTAVEAAEAMAEGVNRVFPGAGVTKVPLADGGEGTVRALVAATGGSIEEVKVTGPAGKPVLAFFGILGDGSGKGNTAVIEMAAASGITLLKEEEKNPLVTTTYGTGELIKAAMDRGCKKIIIGLGGSATNDGGAGMARALGVKFLDARDRELPPGSGALARLAKIDLSGFDRRVKDIKINVACDVDNLLCGPEGASRVYGPQKGATPEMIKILDEALAHYAGVIKEQLGKDVASVPGAGAAGGLGAGLMAFLNGKLKPGIQIVLDSVSFEEKVKNASMVLTGEGRLDGQTAFGKVPAGVAGVAKKYGIPVLAFAGGLGDGFGQLYALGIDYISANLQKPVSLSEAMRDGYRLLAWSVERAMRAIKIGMYLPRSSIRKRLKSS